MKAEGLLSRLSQVRILPGAPVFQAISAGNTSHHPTSDHISFREKVTGKVTSAGRDGRTRQRG
jgi:hypothetical protein